MKVKELMTTNVFTISPDATLKDAGSLIREKKVNGLPVVNTEGVLVGIITLTDLLKMLDEIYRWRELEKSDTEVSLSQMYEHEKSSSKVKDIMSKDVVTLSEEDTLEDVMRLMFEHRIHTIPVTREGKLIGVIGKHDLISACF